MFSGIKSLFRSLIKNKYEALLWIFILAYIAYFSIFTVLKFRHLYAEYFDLGIMHQTVYNTYQAIKTFDFSRVLELTTPLGGIAQVKRMAIHNDIILALLAPFYFIYSGPETILIIQTIVLAIGALLVFKISRLKLKNDLLSLAFAFAYLMYSPMQWANIFEFHAVTLATTFILCMFYAWLMGRLKWSLLFLILALFTKEEVGLTIGMFGIYVALKNLINRKNESRWYQTIVILFSWFWSLLSAFVIIPHFNGGEHFASGYYTDALHNLSKYLFSVDTLQYFFFLLGPLAFLTLLAPEFLIIASPELAINLLSSDLQLRSLMFHYTSAIQPWIFIGAIYGAQRLLKLNLSKKSFYIPAGVIIATCIFSYFKSPLPYSLEKYVDPLLYDRNAEYMVVKKWSDRLASDSIKISSTDQIAPFFTSRRYFYIFSEDYVYADYVIVSPANIEFTYRKDKTIPAYQKLKTDKRFEKVDDEYGYEVYKKLH